MIKIINKISSVKSTNLVYLVENEGDIKKLDFLKLDSKIKLKIKEIIKKWENNQLDFFLWDKNIENLIVFFFDSKWKKTLIEFLAEKFPKISNNITLFSNHENNIETFLDTCVLSRYKFENYKTKKEEEKIYIFDDSNNKDKIEYRIETLKNIIFSRNLWETPPCDLTPEKFMEQVKKINFKNTKVKVLSPKEIEKKGLNLIHAVWRGSKYKPYIVILERIVDKTKPTYGLVWKGVTFDTGGIQVKPDSYMYEMKGDMCGAATTLSVMKELDKKDLNINIVACLCLAENNISGESYKPSDIITAYNGKTVDVIHTDAEWRLVLADGMSYISKKYNLKHIITLATLTWGVLVALWHRYAGIMGTDKKLISNFLEYSKENFEKYIELPFDNYFIEKTKWDIADLKNLTEGIKASSTMWAAFLSNFTDNNELYTHIDIAGTAINSYEAYGLMNKWMTGFWVDSISKIFLSLK